jgi:hypothetical protein
MQPGHGLLHIKVTKADVYADAARRGVDLDAKIIAHITGWRDSVPSGTAVTINKMLIHPVVCACGPGWMCPTCRVPVPGMPLEILWDHIFPSDGSPCAIPGVVGISDTVPHQIKKL